MKFFRNVEIIGADVTQIEYRSHGVSFESPQMA